jgi:hypothetical protein
MYYQLSRVWQANLELLLWKEKSERHKQAVGQNFGGILSEMYCDRSHQNPLVFSGKKLLRVVYRRRHRSPILNKLQIQKVITLTKESFCRQLCRNFAKRYKKVS